MMGPSDLNRFPLLVSAPRAEDLDRYARIEHGDVDLAWMTATARPANSRALGLRAWLRSVLRLTRTPASSQRPAALHPGLAAVHFSGETFAEPRSRHEHVAIERECGLVATTVLMAPRPCGDAEDACTYEH